MTSECLAPTSNTHTCLSVLIYCLSSSSCACVLCLFSTFLIWLRLFVRLCLFHVVNLLHKVFFLKENSLPLSLSLSLSLCQQYVTPLNTHTLYFVPLGSTYPTLSLSLALECRPLLPNALHFWAKNCSANEHSKLPHSAYITLIRTR